MREGDGRPRLTQLELKGFKLACSPKPVKLGMFNLLIGRNGSGKSTLLEALQWVDTGARLGIREACDPYNGIRNLLNKRERRDVFAIKLTYEDQQSETEHLVQVSDDDELPQLDVERLVLTGVKWQSNAMSDRLLEGVRLERAVAASEGRDARVKLADRILNFWRDAVFLKMIPSALSVGARLDRKSSDPILDESGRLLPALLAEVLRDPERKSELLGQLRDILPWTRDLEVPQPVSREIPASYLTHELVGGVEQTAVVPIPAWMLSEGTRRLTAILALLLRDPAPSLVCIEELENGLDPWTVRAVLRALQSAADRGIQVIATTHSPWVLDDVPLDCILQVRRVAGDIAYERFVNRPEVQAYDASIPAGTRYVNEAE